MAAAITVALLRFLINKHKKKKIFLSLQVGVVLCLCSLAVVASTTARRVKASDALLELEIAEQHNERRQQGSSVSCRSKSDEDKVKPLSNGKHIKRRNQPER